VFTLDGVIDLHVHAGPDVLGRVGDDIDIATGCRDAGMAGMAVKAHLESTSSRAYHTNKAVPGFRYIGGVCLNYPVGGINPAAVDACLRLGGRVVWMPSGHSRFHAEVTGALGNWGYSDMDIYNPADAAGISVLDTDGQLTAATREVVALVHEYDALLATSHLSPQEIQRLLPIATVVVILAINADAELFATPRCLAGVMVIVVFSVDVMELLKILEKRMAPWRHQLLARE